MYLKKIENETDSAFSIRVGQAARGLFELRSKNGRGTASDDERVILTISCLTDQTDLALKVISDALVLSSNNVRTKIKNQFGKTLQAYSKKNIQKLEDLESSNKVLLKKVKLQSQSRVAFLKEQKSLATSLGIEKPLPFKQSLWTLSTNFPTLLSDNKYYYLRGYLAIDKEIELILNRNNPEIFLEEFIANEVKKDEILKDKTIIRSKELFSLTPIGTDKFTAISYDLFSVNFIKNTNTLKILFLSIFLGGVIGTLVLYFRNTLIRKE